MSDWTIEHRWSGNVYRIDINKIEIECSVIVGIESASENRRTLCIALDPSHPPSMNTLPSTSTMHSQILVHL